MSTTPVFTIDNVTFSHLLITQLTQTFEVLDGKNSKRTMDGEMKRDIIGTYFNYKLKIKPDYTPEGMQEYAKLWSICSSATAKSHSLTVPFDVGTNVTTRDTMTFNAYITSGSRDMLKFNHNNVDYWKEGEFNFIAMSPKFKG